MRRPSFDFLESIPVLSRSVCEYEKCGSAWSVLIEAGQVMAMARVMLKEGYFLEDVSATDVAEGYYVAYHFDHWDLPGRVTFRVLAPFDNPVVDSITSVYSGAEWHEREATDMVGVEFRGNPNPKPLLLPDDMAEFKPLRRQEEKDRVSLTVMVPFDQLVDLPPDHPLVVNAKKDGAADAEERKPATKRVERKDEE